MFIQVTDRKGERMAINTRYIMQVSELDAKSTRELEGPTLISMVENNEEVWPCVVALEPYDEVVNMIVGMRAVTS